MSTAATLSDWLDETEGSMIARVFSIEEHDLLILRPPGGWIGIEPKPPERGVEERAPDHYSSPCRLAWVCSPRS